MTIGFSILRVLVGLTMASHGAQKLFGWFGGYGIKGTAGFLEQLGFVPGRRNAVMAGLAELVGGLLLTLGLATPLAAVLIVSVMVVAIGSVHLKNGFYNHLQGYEYNLILAVTALSFVWGGPGPLSLDAVLGIQVSGLIWAAAALAAGLVGGAIQLAGRRAPAALKAN
jgi:putative oxidoreductase